MTSGHRPTRQNFNLRKNPGISDTGATETLRFEAEFRDRFARSSWHFGCSL